MQQGAEIPRRAPHRLTGLQRPPFRPPRPQPAVQNRHAVVPKRAEHPPHPRGAEVHARAIVRHDLGVGRDPEVAGHRLECGGGREHVWERRGVVAGEVQIEEL